MCYKRQGPLTLREHLSSHPVFGGVRVAHHFNVVCCPVMCLIVLSSVLLSRFDFRMKTMFGSPLPPVCRSSVSYLRYLCLLAHSGVIHIMCCVFALYFVLCTLCCQFLWIVHF